MTIDQETGEVGGIGRRWSNPAGEIFGALAKAQANIKNAVKDSQNPHFKSRYADLASVKEACWDALTAAGIAVVQMPVNDGPNVGIVTLFAHQSGQWIEGTVFAQPTKFDAQGVGSVITYLRRYSLAAMAGVAPDDDDGEAAVGRPAPQAKEWGANGLRTVPRRQDAAAVGPDQRDAKQQVRELMDAIDATDDAELLLRFAEWPQLLELDEVLKRAVTPAAQAETIAMLVSRAAKRREGLIGSLKPFGFDQ